ncbi:hypothetical protein O0L34_g673 [Tuta absoluta]|nr:hypothetical protein O0L34_g10964 [Tuta absoluta]KAJ2953111.1 hypothetical protein O0L34_g673 [Tuta absoluta]
MNQGGVLRSCAVCNQQTHRRCGRCLSVYYCNTEHQRQDWKRHRTECAPKESKHERKTDKSVECATNRESAKAKDQTVNSIEDSESKPANQEGISSGRRSKKSKKKSKKEGISETSDSKQTAQVHTKNTEQGDGDKEASSSKDSVISSVVYRSKDLCSSKESAITYEGSSEQEILSESAQQLSTVEFSGLGAAGPSNVLRAVNRTPMKMPVKEYPEASLKGSGAPFNSMPSSYYMDPSDPLYEICHRVIRDMTQYGVCVLDNFLGKDRGHLVLNEVLEMYRSGVFTAGQLVSTPVSTEAQTVRSDRITWIDGKETHCHFIRQLISYVDNIVLRANKMANNGKMGDYVINGRTKAMVAVYPGCGSHYVKHVDNPNRDGRCITAIYYLNTDWDVKKCGGLLRVFPEGTDQVADIAPIFDRMLFFWSDRRNPHEVQPAYATRYAITLWYFDAHEREEARRNYKERGQPIQPSSSK